MSQLAKQYYNETGEKAMYKIGACDYQTIRYINWLEDKVEKFTSTNKAQQLKSAIISIISDIECDEKKGLFEKDYYINRLRQLSAAIIK